MANHLGWLRSRKYHENFGVLKNVHSSGCKCICPSQQTRSGDILHDSHAEVLCRRALVKYMFAQLGDKDQQVVERDPLTNLYRTRPGVQFHMYISQAPCGDASTVSLSSVDQSAVSDSSVKISEKLYRGRSNYSQLNVLRTKPGRLDAEQTTSLSCSDKLSKWMFVGLQGSLLANFMEPFFLDTLTIGRFYDAVHIERAIMRPFTVDARPKLVIRQATIEFPHGQTTTDAETSVFSSSNWIAGFGDTVEVTVNGRKQGASLDKQTRQYSPKTRSRLCKYELALDFLDVWRTYEAADGTRSYKELKGLCTAYLERKRLFHSLPVFEEWLFNDVALNEFSVLGRI